MPFDVLEVSLELASSLRRPLEQLWTRNRDLHDQIRRATVSISLNLAEGRERNGADRRYHWRIAAGSAGEVRTGLRLATALGELDADGLQVPMALLDRVCAMLFRLTR